MVTGSFQGSRGVSSGRRAPCLGSAWLPPAQTLWAPPEAGPWVPGQVEGAINWPRILTKVWSLRMAVGTKQGVQRRGAHQPWVPFCPLSQGLLEGGQLASRPRTPLTLVQLLAKPRKVLVQGWVLGGAGSGPTGLVPWPDPVRTPGPPCVPEEEVV